MAYVLSTTSEQVKWYRFDVGAHLKPGEYTFMSELDLRQVPCFGDKETAKQAALRLGLKT
jgi:hypothetical protein